MMKVFELKSERVHECNCGHMHGGLKPSEDVMDVEQRNDENNEVLCVTVEGITTVKSLPARKSSMNTYNLLQGSAELLFGADPRIRRVILVANGANIWVGTREQLTNGKAAYGFLMPNGVPVTFEGIHDDHWSFTNTASVTISARFEYWTD